MAVLLYFYLAPNYRCFFKLTVRK